MLSFFLPFLFWFRAKIECFFWKKALNQNQKKIFSGSFEKRPHLWLQDLPWMFESLLARVAFLDVQTHHVAYKVLGRLGYIVPVGRVELILALEYQRKQIGIVLIVKRLRNQQSINQSFIKWLYYVENVLPDSRIEECTKWRRWTRRPLLCRKAVGPGPRALIT